MSASSPQLPLGIALPESATLAGYVAGANGAALTALRGLAAGDRLYLHGPAASGKSHLLQAVCRASPGRAAYLPLGELAGHPPAVLDGLEGLDRVCLDEVDAVAGDRGWEEALVGFLDGLRARGTAVVAAGPRPADELGLALPDLASRLAWGAVYALQPLDDEGKRRLLCRRAEARGLAMPPEVADFVIRRAPRDVRALLTLLDRLDRASLAAKRRLTVPFVKTVLDA
ncbi:DnaA-like protein hda [Salinisphaera sp. PC39]|uniref:DnaA regulatory inactivator Hda n=1 Tax=Salinisphaera sp. PC39 TaxID=1304156 RepID=UPI00333F411E